MVAYHITGVAQLMFKAVNVPENSLVASKAISNSYDDTLKYVTDYTPCCAMTLRTHVFFSGYISASGDRFHNQ